MELSLQVPAQPNQPNQNKQGNKNRNNTTNVFLIRPPHAEWGAQGWGSGHQKWSSKGYAGADLGFVGLNVDICTVFVNILKRKYRGLKIQNYIRKRILFL